MLFVYIFMTLCFVWSDKGWFIFRIFANVLCLMWVYTVCIMVTIIKNKTYRLLMTSQTHGSSFKMFSETHANHGKEEITMRQCWIEQVIPFKVDREYKLVWKHDRYIAVINMKGLRLTCVCSPCNIYCSYLFYAVKTSFCFCVISAHKVLNWWFCFWWWMLNPPCQFPLLSQWCLCHLIPLSAGYAHESPNIHHTHQRPNWADINETAKWLCKGMGVKQRSVY